MKPSTTLARAAGIISTAILLGLGMNAPALAQNPLVEIKTSMGSITAELNKDKAPKTVANFLQYVKDGHYKGTIFHRVIDGFMAQGGGMEASMVEKKTRAPIDNEAANGLKNALGTLAMARTNAVHSATAQFFINLKDNDFLNYRESTPDGYGYAVFGKVVKGMDVVERMAKVSTGKSGPHGDVPRIAIVVESVTLLPASAAKALLAPASPAPSTPAAPANK
jgi:peptidyl-prolyl cis-trans isomerase B (cyclophilin B)